MKRHSTFLRRTLALVYGTVLLFAVLIIAIYNVISPRLFAQNKIDDLIPKGQIIAGYIESTLRGEISTAYLVPLIGRSTSQWEATVWVVDVGGDTLIRTQQSSGRRVGKLPAALANSMLPTVLSGEVATHIGSPEDLVATRTAAQDGSQSQSVLGGIAEQSAQEGDTSGEEVMNGSIVAVALPITFWGDVVGAVFMAQSMTEVMSGMQALSNTITFSLLLVALLLLPVVIYFASRMSRPLARMRSVALTLAGGDLTVRADDQRPDEFGELGRALNFLSSELGATISSCSWSATGCKASSTACPRASSPSAPGARRRCSTPPSASCCTWTCRPATCAPPRRRSLRSLTRRSAAAKARGTRSGAGIPRCAYPFRPWRTRRAKSPAAWASSPM